MEIRQREVDGVTVLELLGKVTRGEPEAKLKTQMAALIGRGRKHLVIDLGGVPYVDSSGLGELVRCFATAQRSGGSVKLANVSRRVVDLLSITKLSSVLESYTTVEEAIASHELGQ